MTWTCLVLLSNCSEVCTTDIEFISDELPAVEQLVPGHVLSLVTLNDGHLLASGSVPLSEITLLLLSKVDGGALLLAAEVDDGLLRVDPGLDVDDEHVLLEEGVQGGRVLGRGGDPGDVGGHILRLLRGEPTISSDSWFLPKQ